MKKTHNKYKKRLKHSKNLLKFGQFGFKIINFKSISKKQNLLIITFINKKLKELTLKKKTKIWHNIPFNKNLTKLNIESRMGKGKGSIYTQNSYLLPGTIFFEIEEINFKQIEELFNYLKKKLSIKLTLIFKYNN